MPEVGSGDEKGIELLRLFLERTDSMLDPAARARALNDVVRVSTVRRWLREREQGELRPPLPAVQQAIADYLEGPTSGGEEYRRGFADALTRMQATLQELADMVGAPLIPVDRFHAHGDGDGDADGS